MAEAGVTTPDSAPGGRMEDRWALDDIAVLVGFHREAHPAEIVRAVRAVSSAPPVDIPTRIRAAAHAAFTAMDKGVLMSETGDGAESVLAVGHLHLIAEYLERHPDWPSAQAIVRALATPTTEET